MRITSSMISAFAVGALLAACSNNTAEIANMDVKGGAYEKGLHTGYLELATSEHAEDDWSDASKFEERAKLAAMGKPSAPERLSDRAIPKDHLSAISAGRERLADALSRGGARMVGEHAAAAQTAFDCWMQEAEENTQPEHIKSCKKEFDAAMVKLEAALGAAPATVASKPVKRVAVKSKKRTPQTTQYVLYFDFDSAKINAAGMNAIDLIKKDVKRDSVVSLAGYTDRSGSEKYNNLLSAKRARSVFSALKQAGLKNQILTSAYGEKKNAVATKDGVAHRLNRRVELFITR